jgi:hypothetical protein
LTSSDDHRYVMAIIARHTRDGHTQWQNVAAVLGRCVADVRRDYDFTIPTPPAGSRVFPADFPPELIIDRSSPTAYPRMKAAVLLFLLKGPTTSEFIAGRICRRHEAVRARLSELKAEGYAVHNEAWGRATSRTWQVTAEGRAFARALPALQRSPKTERAFS